MNGNVDISGTIVNGSTITSTGAVLPASSDGAALGSASAEWSDVFVADAGVLNLGDDQEVTLTHVHNTGVLLNSTNEFQFRDNALKVHSSTDGQLDIDADTEVEITGTTIDMNGNVDISGTIVNGSTITSTGAVLPASSDGAALGSASAEWSDVFVADAGVLNLGDDQEVTLTHVHNTGVLLNSTNEFQFRDNALKVHSSTDGQLDIDADTEVEITGTTIDMNGNVDISGTIVNGSTITSTGAVLPASSDGAALGSASAEWSDVFVADAGVLNLGDDQEVTLTHVHNTGVLLNSTNEFQFRDNALKVHSSTDGQLDIDADTEVEITGTTIDMNGEATISGNLSLDGTSMELRFYEGANYVGFEAPSLSADKIWVLPAADGSNNQVLKTDGSGNLSWADVSASSIGTLSGATPLEFEGATSDAYETSFAVTDPTADRTITIPNVLVEPCDYREYDLNYNNGDHNFGVVDCNIYC